MRDRFARPPLERMMKLHHELQGRRFPNCRKLAETLEVSTKTVQRDIDFMRDRLGLPIEYDQIHFGFFYTEPVTSFPSIEVSEGEIVALLVAQKALAQYRGTPFEKPLGAAFQKITDGLKDRVNFNLGEVDGGISFKGIGTTIADLDLFETVSKAVLRSCEMEFEYKKLGGAKFEGRRVQPYHLGCVENQWYLFAFDLARRQLRTFVLARMRKVRNTNLKFRRPEEFTIEKHLSGSFGVFKGRGRHRVRIRFDGLAAQLVAERQWHSTQKLRMLGEAGLELRMELGSLEEIERWVLGWGGDAVVLEPEELRERVAAQAAAIAARYAPA
jgi:proteasome accessory factor B